MAEKKKTVAFEVAPEMHAAWSAAAKKAGVSLRAYVTGCVESHRLGTTMREPGHITNAARRRAEARAASTKRTASVRPQDCTARVRAGAYCRVCDSIHVKGSF